MLPNLPQHQNDERAKVLSWCLCLPLSILDHHLDKLAVSGPGVYGPAHLLEDYIPNLSRERRWWMVSSV